MREGRRSSFGFREKEMLDNLQVRLVRVRHGLDQILRRVVRSAVAVRWREN